MPPVNRATGAPVVVVISTSTVLSVEATVPEDIVIMPIPDAMVVMLDMPDITELELLLERAHPTKFEHLPKEGVIDDMATLTVEGIGT
ncbi:MAG: hypothetical protein LQ347_006947 [Umbilicaria vellea]|nr:MAG: hypothetical protein LQ347_006947 [Umbilicaria vellea]